MYTPSELAQSSYIHTGLFELENEKYLKCKIKLRLKKDLGTLEIKGSKINYSKRPQPKTSFYDIKKDNNKVVKIAIDLYDDPSKFSTQALKKCDYVFKRNFQKKNINKLPKEYSEKIFPLGFTTGCVSRYRHGTLKIYLGLFIYLFKINIKFDRLFFSRLRTLFNSFKANFFFDKKNRDVQILRNFKSHKRKQVFFQTRCFQDELSVDNQKLHKTRNNIINELKKNIGSFYKGGFIKSKIALKNYKKNVSTIDEKIYYNEIAESQITVYSNGLLTSPAWKMAEYLSKGNVILSEILTTDLPFELKDNKHLIYFKNAKDCGEKAKQILNDKNKIRFLSKNAREYFEKYVDPAKNIKRIINFILSTEGF